MRAVFLVPRRADGGQRDRIWAYCRRRWAELFPDVEIVEGSHDEGPFNRSAAINRAAAAAGDWDLAIVIDADVMLSRSQVQQAIDTAASTGRVTWAHRRWRGIREDATARILADGRRFDAELDRDALDLIVERTNPLSWSCCFVVPRAVFDSTGGFDERFRGWGFEDMAWQSLIVGLYGHERIPGDVVHLWHPRSEERIVQGESRGTASPEYVTNARLGRRYMVALRRDHQQHDRDEGPVTDEDRARDIRNLMADDAKYDAVVRRFGLPDWSTWWPTLEELRDGAKEHRNGPPPAVTLIVRTGGEPGTWDDRVGYLQRSIASLVERVSGPIVKRVVYSDWGAGRRDELAAIVEPFGFYVVGPDQHVGYTEACRLLWRYIDGRVRTDFVFLTEDDFLYERDVDLVPMVEALEADPYLAQVALLRDPYASEAERGGVLGWPDESFTRRDITNGHGRLEHRNFWTMNPSVVRRSIARTPWPTRSSSERVFGDLLLRDPKTRFALWGDGASWVTHIGSVRAASAY